MNRTVVAALVAAGITFAAVAGVGALLGFDRGAAVLAGAVLGLLAGLLIWAAARRAEGFQADREIRPVDPGFPGPPDHDDPAGNDD